ncbi:uncharacterized protein V6R79_021004 [Siganus canaliculatus]
MNKLSASLRSLTVEPQNCVKNGLRTNQLQPLGNKGILMTDVVKFGPMLQNSLLASSIAKAVQVLGTTLCLQQLKNFLIPQAVAVQQEDKMCSITSSYNCTIVTANSPSHLKAEEREHTVIVEEKCPPDALISPPAISQGPKINTEKPPILVPHIEAVFPQTSNPTPMKIPPLISWGCEDDVKVQYQKLTSSQLLHFLRANAKDMSALESTLMEWTSVRQLQSVSPVLRVEKFKFRQTTDDLIHAQAPKSLNADVENQTPVFRVKKVETSGSLIYTCVIATKNELWDIGDIFTEGRKEDSEAALVKRNEDQNATMQAENHTSLPWTDREHEGSAAVVKTPVIDDINIPEFQNRKFVEIEVVICQVVSPGNFYIQHVDAITKLNALVTNSLKASRSYAEQNCIPDIGTKVMGWFPKQEQWCRAQVTKICGVSGDRDTDSVRSDLSIMVEVKRLDYGDTACISLWNTKELTPEMAILPLQALQVSLANVTPANGSDWSEEAVSWFQAMVHNRTLYARLYPQGTTVTVELFLEKGRLGAMRRGASLSLRLTQNGHAKHSKLRNSGLMKTSAIKLRNQESEWEKYVLSCYIHNMK